MKTAKDQADWAKQKNFFDKDFLEVQMKNPQMVEPLQKQRLYQAKKTALILGGVLVISLISVVYAFVQETLAREAQRKTEILAKQYTECKHELEMQEGLAQESALITEEVTRMAEEQLKLCQAGR